MRVNLAAQLFVICLSVQEYESYTLAGLSFCWKCIKFIEAVVSIETDVRLTWAAANFWRRGHSGLVPLPIKLHVP